MSIRLLCCLCSGKVLDLGHASPRHPPAMLQSGNGVVLNYTNGDLCGDSKQRYQTQLLLTCNMEEALVSQNMASAWPAVIFGSAVGLSRVCLRG